MNLPTYELLCAYARESCELRLANVELRAELAWIVAERDTLLHMVEALTAAKPTDTVKAVRPIPAKPPEPLPHWGVDHILEKLLARRAAEWANMRVEPREEKF